VVDKFYMYFQKMLIKL